MEKDNDTNNLIKIDNNYLENISTKSVLPFFGNWTQNIDKLKEQYLNVNCILYFKQKFIPFIIS